MKTGTVKKWLVKPGDKIRDGMVIASIETDKTDLEFEYNGDEAIFGAFVVEEDVPAAVTGPIAVLCDQPSEIDAAKAEAAQLKSSGGSAPAAEKPASPKDAPPAEPKPAAKAAAPAAPAAPAAAAPVAAAASSSGRVAASPLAFARAAELGIDIASVATRNPLGVTARDVEAAAAGGGAKAAPRAAAEGAAAPAAARAVSRGAGDYTDSKASQVRKVIAERLTESKNTIPHFYLTADVGTAAATQLLEALNASQAREGDKATKITATALIVRAAAVACLRVPEVNTHWVDGTLRQYNRVDVNVAVATPGGLMTPIVFNADLKGLGEVAETIKSLAERARAKQLQPAEYQGGTFTVSNLGGKGSVIDHFTAIINPPQSAILAVGRTQRPRGVTDAAAVGAGPHDFMRVTLSCDHRVVDGAVGSEWLKHFVRIYEDPLRLLV